MIRIEIQVDKNKAIKPHMSKMYLTLNYIKHNKH